MTDAMLRLARAVYGEAAHVGPQYEWHMDGSVTYRDVVVRVATEDNDIEPFDPANNAGQFCDVLAWLCSADRGEDTFAPDFFGRSISVHGIPYVSHDGTASGIRRAVVEAAMRVVE